MRKYFFTIVIILVVKCLSAQTITYSYDNLGRLTMATYPDSSIISYNYDASGNRTSVRVKNKNYHKPQTITFRSLTLTYGMADTDPGATASSGLPVSYASSNTAIATIVNNKIHIISAGTVTITASQAGNVNYSAAADVAQTLTIVNPISNNANLAGLTLSSGTLSPAFVATTTNYTDIVSSANASITISPTIANAGATIKVNGAPVASGATSASLPLSVGTNIISVVVTAQDGTTTKIYTITVTRPLSNVATLSKLTISNGVLSPSFASTNTSYTDLVSYGTTAVYVTPTVADANATVKVNGVAVQSGVTSPYQSLQVGPNVITTVVTAQDGATTQTYTVTVTRMAPAAIATLSNLSISSGTLTPAFASTTTAYTASVVNSITSITLIPTKSDTGATVKVNGIAISSGAPSASIPLVVGNNTITTVVTAQDGVTTKTYSLTVTRAAPLSTTATLSNFTISSGTLSPAFTTAKTSYVVSVANSVTSVLVRPTATDATATIKVNGTTVASGAVSGSIPLTVGTNTINAVVTAQDGVTTKTYTITVTRATSDIATLGNFTISRGVLSPTFATATTNYAVSLTNSVTSVVVRPTATDATATIKVNGTTVASGAVSGSIPLTVGTNTINAVVTAQDGVTTKTYTITVTRATSTIATLSNFTISNGTLSPAFATVTTNYAVSVTGGVTSVLVRPTATEATATIKVNGTTVASGAVSGSIPLTVGTNTINAVVTAQDGVTTKTYTITVTRATSTIANLSNFTISNGTLSPAFATATTNYAVSVTGGVTSVLVRPTATDASATIKVNGTTVASGAVSGSIQLAVGANTINAVVTAQDGVTTKTYTITVTRATSTIATLGNFTISNGTLSPAFATAKTSYSVSVANNVTFVLVRPTATDATATIKVNGTTVASGTVSGSIPLAVGNNTINNVVTAQDGVTTKTYMVTVTRAMSGMNNLYLPGNRDQTPMVSFFNEEVIANNILSLNGDGVNDIWVVKNIAFYPNNSVTVYDKSGRVVFSKKGYANDWAGTYRGSVLNQGTYYYLLDLGNGSTVKGFITVVSDK